MLGESAGLAFITLASTYAVLGQVTFPGALPAAKQVGTLAEISFAGVVFTIVFMFLLFPTGKLPSRRWRPLAAAGLLLTGLTTIGLVVQPRRVQLPAPGGISLFFGNPLAVQLPPVLRVVLIGTINGLSVIFVPFLAAAFVSLVVRYRAGGRLLRQQIKWLALVAVGFVVCQLIALLLIPLGQAWLSGIVYAAVAIIALAGGIQPAARRPARRQRQAPAVRIGIAGGRRPARGRAARCTVPAQAAERAADRRGGQATAAPGLTGGPGAAQRPAHRRPAGHDRRAAGLPPPAGRGAGRRTAEDRAEPARRSPAAAHRAEDPPQAAGRRRRGPRRRPADHAPPQGGAPGRARRSAGPGPRHLPAAAGRAGPHRGPASAGPQGAAAGTDRGARHRALPAGHRDHRVLLYPGALQNIAKYARATQAAIRLACPDGSLQFIISDDGAGFDASQARRGSGLQGMADRLAALGGTLDIQSQPGHGTTLSGQLPVSPDEC